MTDALGQRLSPGILLEQGLHLSARRRGTEIGSGINSEQQCPGTAPPSSRGVVRIHSPGEWAAAKARAS